MSRDKEFLEQAVKLAEKSSEKIKCATIIVKDGEIISSAFNSQRADNQAIHHAEIKAVIEANRAVDSRTLEGSNAYCSCEPCAMCLVALSYAKISKIVYNKSMKDLCPDDPQSNLNASEFVKGLNFIPKLEQIKL